MTSDSPLRSYGAMGVTGYTGPTGATGYLGTTGYMANNHMNTAGYEQTVKLIEATLSRMNKPDISGLDLVRDYSRTQQNTNVDPTLIQQIMNAIKDLRRDVDNINKALSTIRINSQPTKEPIRIANVFDGDLDKLR